MAAIGQDKLNGAVESGQFLVGSLTHYEIDVDGSGNVLVTGYDGTDPEPGEELHMLVGTICNPVIWEVVDANVVHFAAEVAGHSADDIATAINAGSFTGATVTVGTYTVTV